MFFMDEGEKVKHMIPGQGWRLLIANDPEVSPRVVEEPVIAWAIVEMKDRVDHGEGLQVQQLVPIVRETLCRGYKWEFSQWEDLGTVLLAPGEERTPEHDERAIKRQEEVARDREKKYAKWDEARKLRREGLSYEAIAAKVRLSRTTARALALQEDEAMRREKK
jgi:hypothetical protein